MYDYNNKYSQFDSQYIYDNTLKCRSSMDRTVCSRGRRLLELCSQSGLRITNGRIFGDLTGKFTSHCTLGSSAIDYILCSESILQKLLFMEVHDFICTLSNHCLISCVLSVNFLDVLNRDNTRINLTSLPHKYLWNSQSSENFQSSLRLPTIANKINDFMECKYTCNGTCENLNCFVHTNETSLCKIEQLVSDFQHIILSAANISLKAKPYHKKMKRKYKDKKWFDKSLHDLKNSVNKLSRELAFNPFDRELRHRCFCLN